jgi:hypothetical protein
MDVLAKPRMNVDEFLAWAKDHPGRYELFRGECFKCGLRASGTQRLRVPSMPHS